ncbi:dTDP-4-dehydrorhamnose reductase [Effusibacillus dendaii]|uniref:dTDP-4-dehydrorhamnose reductase n=1 Tax=Effusibacillus dendaii TaxID=2743772 RepID=A0A7I8DG08_9BACL|nr:dTDP-4-dehydrorhamnose reductase [Effusibacillus dendaii]BCJ87796.1 NAD(P)-dependent oxidoreductase [Effusibacillus dendaii]
MRVLVTGANGQLGKDVVKILSERHEVHGFGRDRLDITDLTQCREVVRSIRPDIIIHAAAYTAVDLAESEEDQAYRLNALGTRNIALASREVEGKICYISTDYVFDGMAESPYREYDHTNPINVYGKSKHAGEQFVQTMTTKHFIVRTSWVYGLHGNNFVKTMLKLGKERESLQVVNDQIGSPTYTVDLAHFLEQLITTDFYGIYHATNAGVCSWFEFANAIFEESGITVNVNPCTTEEFPRPAARPNYSVLDHMAIRTNGLSDLRHWREALKDFMQEFKNQNF